MSRHEALPSSPPAWPGLLLALGLAAAAACGSDEAPRCELVDGDCPAGCRSITGVRVDLDAGCFVPEDEVLDCEEDDLVEAVSTCARRGEDGALFLVSGLIDPGGELALVPGAECEVATVCE